MTGWPIQGSLPFGRAGHERAAAAGPDDPRIPRKARKFEAVLLGQVVQILFQGLHDGGPFGGGSAEAQWKDMLAQEYGRALAETGGIGLALAIEREMRAAAAGRPVASQNSGEAVLPRAQASDP